MRIEKPEWTHGVLVQASDILRPTGNLLPGYLSFISLWKRDENVPEIWIAAVGELTSGIRLKVMGALQPMALHGYHIYDVRNEDYEWLRNIPRISEKRADFIWQTFVE